MIGACVVVLALGSYLYANSMTNCLKKILLEIDRCIKTNQEYLSKQLVEFIKFHSHLQQLSEYGAIKLIFSNKFKKYGSLF